ncbi:hypothetical protein AVEN_242832-1 [Araneus ventricosus]|uniref:Uncharacterized protein n=1 Tax=Araneus ventricosus TaxID=182803 RepID=A0A4Y2K2T1_ARAVE|nr:hypothetical protein AVEN_242832-1 [Araneus ventricosus]
MRRMYENQLSNSTLLIDFFIASSFCTQNIFGASLGAEPFPVVQSDSDEESMRRLSLEQRQDITWIGGTILDQVVKHHDSPNDRRTQERCLVLTAQGLRCVVIALWVFGSIVVVWLVDGCSGWHLSMQPEDVSPGKVSGLAMRCREYNRKGGFPLLQRQDLK